MRKAKKRGYFMVPHKLIHRFAQSQSVEEANSEQQSNFAPAERDV
jgi:hypothetical protein